MSLGTHWGSSSDTVLWVDAGLLAASATGDMFAPVRRIADAVLGRLMSCYCWSCTNLEQSLKVCVCVRACSIKEKTKQISQRRLQSKHHVFNCVGDVPVLADGGSTAYGAHRKGAFP